MQYQVSLKWSDVQKVNYLLVVQNIAKLSSTFSFNDATGTKQ